MNDGDDVIVSHLIYFIIAIHKYDESGNSYTHTYTHMHTYT